MYDVPGQPAFQALAFSPAGELAVPTASGGVQTYARGSATPNLTAPGGVDGAQVAYDGLGDLAVGTGSQILVFAPAVTTAAYTLSAPGEQSFAFDSSNRLVVGLATSIEVFAAGSSTVVRTIANVRPVALAVDPQGDIATAGFTSANYVFRSNGTTVTINGLFQAASVAISP